MRPAYQRFEFWCVVAILVCFFFPWVAWGPLSLAGYQVGDIFRQGSSRRDQDVVLMTILIYLVPATALVALAADLTTASKATRSILHLIAGVAPFLALGLACSKMGADLLKGLSIGAYLTLLAAIGSLVGSALVTARPQFFELRGRARSAWTAPHSLTALTGILAIVSGLWTTLNVSEAWYAMANYYWRPPTSAVLGISVASVTGLLALGGGVGLMARSRIGVFLAAAFAALHVLNFLIFSSIDGISPYIRIPFLKTLEVGKPGAVAISLMFAGAVGFFLGFLWHRYGLPPQPEFLTDGPGLTEEPSLETRLEQLRALEAKGLISSEDYESRKQDLLSQFVQNR